MTDKQKWADKIAALLRKAESTTPEEAESLFAKAQELMAKYAIDEAMLRASGQDKRTDPINWDEFVTVGIYRHALYMLDYYVLLVNGCKPIEIPGSPWKTIDGKVFKQTRVLRAVGHQSDLEKARLLATYLKLQCMRAESVWWNENKSLYAGYNSSKQHQARRGFMMAFGSAVHKRMQDAADRARVAADEQYGGDSVALVLRDKSLAVQDEFERMYPETRKSRSRISAGDAYARNAGREAGRRADIGGTKVGGGSRRELGG